MNQNERKTQSNIDGRKYIKIYLSDIVKGLQKFWWICVAAAVVLGGYRVINEYRSYVPRYTASATITVSSQGATENYNGISVYSFYYDANTASQITTTFPYILSSSFMQDAICEDLDISYIPATLQATSVSGTNMVTITSTSKDPQSAYDVLMSALKEYPYVAKYIVGNIKFKMITNPQVPTEPSNSVDYIGEALKGAAFGVVFGLLIVFIYVVQRRTVKSQKDIKNELNHETLSIIPYMAFKKRSTPVEHNLLVSNSEVSSGFKEAFRILRNVFVASIGENDKVIMATSSAPGEGKTTVVTNLAISLASYNKRVLLVDADIRHPSVAPLLNLDVENAEAEAETDSYKIINIEELRIHVLMPTLNKSDRAAYFSSESSKNMLDSLRDDYDYILVDTPPCGLISDAMYIAQAADAVIYIIHQDAVRISRIKSGLDNLMSTDINIIGCVLNGATGALTGYGYGYGKYGYGYGKYGYGKYGYGKYGYGYGEKKEHHKSKRRNKEK